MILIRGYITEVQAPEGLRYIILTTYAEGSVLNYTNPEDSRRFGESTAKLHNLSEDFTTTYKRNILNTFVLIRHFWWIGFSLENIGGFEHEAISENSINYYLDFLKKHTDNNSSKLID